jgi:hypothetical protein
MRRSDHVRAMMRRSQQRKSTASPTSHQQSRPKILPQPMGRSVLAKKITQIRPQPRRLTASLMKLQQMERNVVVRMMRPRSHQQRRLIPSLRLLSMPHDTPPHPLVVFSMHCQGCFTGVYLGGVVHLHEVFLHSYFTMAVWSWLM